MPTLQYDGLITIATGSSRRSASWKTKEMLWSEFVDKLGRVTRTQETQQEYFRMPKEERDNAKDVGGFVGGTLKGGRRKIDAVLQRRLITLDMDSDHGGRRPVAYSRADSGLRCGTLQHAQSYGESSEASPLCFLFEACVS